MEDLSTPAYGAVVIAPGPGRLPPLGATRTDAGGRFTLVVKGKAPARLVAVHAAHGDGESPVTKSGDTVITLPGGSRLWRTTRTR